MILPFIRFVIFGTWKLFADEEVLSPYGIFHLSENGLRNINN